MLTMPTGRKVVILDALVAAWSAMWIFLGVVSAQEVAELTELSGTFETVGMIVTDVGGTLGGLEVPLLSTPLERAGDAIEVTGREIVGGGQSLRDKVERISLGAGLAIALIPTLTLLLLYGPARLARAGEAGALRGLLREGDGDPELETFLAARALDRASYRRLREISSRPWELGSAPTRRTLAEEELRRLGVSPRALGPSSADREP